MIARTARRTGLPVVLLLAAACATGADPAGGPSASTTASPRAAFPVATFAALDEDPVTEERAARFQTALSLHDVSDAGGMSATVMTPEGMWSGTTGKADGVRDLQVDDQFSIASIAKSVVAAQVMLMVEAGELALDDPVAEHLPEDLSFDTNDATVRQLLSHRAGIPDYYNLLEASQQVEPRRVWTASEILTLLPPHRSPPGRTFAYTETSFLLLGLMIEHLRGQPLGDVLREGSLRVDGLERLVLQPDGRPTEPMAVPGGAPRSALEIRGGYLPSLAAVTAYHGIASDSRSLARWWRAFCAGEIVSASSLAEMSALEPADHVGSYGLGLSNPAKVQAAAFGHVGQLPGYMSWAACLPAERAVIVVLTNHDVDDGHLAYSYGLARPLIDALRAG